MTTSINHPILMEFHKLIVSHGKNECNITRYNLFLLWGIKLQCLYSVVILPTIVRVCVCDHRNCVLGCWNFFVIDCPLFVWFLPIHAMLRVCKLLLMLLMATLHGDRYWLSNHWPNIFPMLVFWMGMSSCLLECIISKTEKPVTATFQPL